MARRWCGGLCRRPGRSASADLQLQRGDRLNDRPHASCGAGWRSSNSFALFTVGAALFVDTTLLTVVIPILPDYLKLTDPAKATDTWVGVMLAAKAICQLVTNVFAGGFVDRIGRRIPLLLGFVLVVGSTLLFAFAQGYWALLAARGIQGVGSGLTMTAGMALIADRYKEDEARGAAMGKAMAAVGLGVVVGPPFGGVVYGVGGKELPFFILAGLALVDGVLQMLLLPPRGTREEIGLLQHFDDAASLSSGDSAYGLMEDDEALPSGARSQQRQGMLSLLGHPEVLRLCLVYLSICMLIGMLEPTFPLYMASQFQSTPLTTGLIFITVAGAYMVASPLAGALGARLSRHKLGAAGLLLLAVSTPLVVLPTRGSKYYTIPPLLGVGAAMGAVESSLMPLLANAVDTHTTGQSVYGSVFALADMSASTGNIVGPLLGGFLAVHLGTGYAYVIVAGLSLLTIPLLLWGLLCGGKGARKRTGGGDKGGGEEAEEEKQEEDAPLVLGDADLIAGPNAWATTGDAAGVGGVGP